MFDLDSILRKNIRSLVPYSSARDDFHGKARIFLDANENPYGNGLNRYPDPHHSALKEKLSLIKGVPPEAIFCGNGSDEAIDLLFRAFCEPGHDQALICPPTYGMYKVSAGINNVDVLEVPLDSYFQLNTDEILKTVTSKTVKLTFICSPNNPTGNSMDAESVSAIASATPGIVVIDEAYIDFSTQDSFCNELSNFPNIVVLQTLSKAMGGAGIRLGMACANPRIIEILNRIKPPYNISTPAQEAAMAQLERGAQIAEEIHSIKAERDKLALVLSQMDIVEHVFPSDANFLLARFQDPNRVYRFLLSRGIVVRDRSSLVEGCLRITIGTPEENRQLIDILMQYS